MEDFKPGENRFEGKTNKGDAAAEIQARFDAYLGGAKRPEAARPPSDPFQIGPGF